MFMLSAFLKSNESLRQHDDEIVSIGGGFSPDLFVRHVRPVVHDLHLDSLYIYIYIYI